MSSLKRTFHASVDGEADFGTKKLDMIGKRNKNESIGTFRK